MKLTFYGAARAVTGSCHCIEACGKRILVDCGLQQGRDEIDNQALPFAPNLIDVVLITHAHIDHSGLLPLLYKNGFDAGKYVSWSYTLPCRPGQSMSPAAHISVCPESGKV